MLHIYSTHSYILMYLQPFTGFEPGSPALLARPITTTLYYLFISQTFLIYIEIARHPSIAQHHISFTYFRMKESLFIFFSQQTLLNCRDNSRHIYIFMITWHLALLGKYASTSTQRVDVRAPQPLVFMPQCNAVQQIMRGCGEEEYGWTTSYKVRFKNISHDQMASRKISKHRQFWG